MKIIVDLILKDKKGEPLNEILEGFLFDTNNKIMEKDGAPLRIGIPNPDGVLKLRDVCIQACLTGNAEDKNYLNQVELYKIYEQFRDADKTISLTADEITKVQTAIGKLPPELYNNLVKGQACIMLDKAEEEKKSKKK